MYVYFHVSQLCQWLYLTKRDNFKTSGDGVLIDYFLDRKEDAQRILKDLCRLRIFHGESFVLGNGKFLTLLLFRIGKNLVVKIVA